MKNNSYWLNGINCNHQNPKMINKTDILIIGAGMTGLMIGYELSKNKKDIIIVDSGKIFHGVSSKTTAKLTTMHNQLYQDINAYHGLKKAKLYYKSQKEALDYIINIIETEKIDCDLEKQDSYIYATNQDGTNKLLKEFSILKKIGLDVELIDNLKIDIKIKYAIKCNNQYMFHPMKYLNKIKDIIEKKRIPIYQNYNAIKIEKENNYYNVLFSNGEKIKTNKIIMANHYPFFNPSGMYYAKLYQENNYLVAFKTEKNIDGMYINSEKPVLSLRSYNNGNEKIGIMVGNSHKAGNKVNYHRCMSKLKNSVYEFDKNAIIINEWTNQDVMSIDFLPFIGQYSRFHPNIYVATAFHTWGMTNSHVAALLISKEITNTESEYKKLYSPLRFSHIRSPIESIKIIGKAINGLIISRFFTYKNNLKNIKEKSGDIIKYKGKYYAVYRISKNEYIYLKPNCPHTYCFMQWNNNEKTWDCKCHGSRFDIYGNVIIGPATKSLKRVYF